jgi:Asp-tRNA(Asn)/Glu-tRNA(Gln) amidotransferase A subunit family amidase
MKIGLLVRSPLGKTDALCVEAAEQAARALERAGHRVVPIERVEAGLDEFMPIYQRLLAGVPVIFESRLQPVTKWFRAEGPQAHRRGSATRARRALCTLHRGAR